MENEWKTINKNLVIKKDRYDGFRSQTQRNYNLNDEGLLAAVFLEKWGMVQGAPDGEDTAGRSKSKLLSVEETVNRALEMSELFYKKALEKGMASRLPNYYELDEIFKDADK